MFLWARGLNPKASIKSIPSFMKDTDDDDRKVRRKELREQIERIGPM